MVDDSSFHFISSHCRDVSYSIWLSLCHLWKERGDESMKDEYIDEFGGFICLFVSVNIYCSNYREPNMYVIFLSDCCDMICGCSKGMYLMISEAVKSRERVSKYCSIVKIDFGSKNIYIYLRIFRASRMFIPI